MVMQTVVKSFEVTELPGASLEGALLLRRQASSCSHHSLCSTVPSARDAAPDKEGSNL